MIEIILLFIAIGGVASLARGRGGKPIIWGTIAVVGYFLAVVVTGLILMTFKVQGSIVPSLAGWIWIGCVSLFLRFGLGSKYKAPDSQWFCVTCKTLNKRSSVICEACREPWEAQQRTFGDGPVIPE